MKIFKTLIFVTALATVSSYPLAKDLSDNQLLGLCIVAAGNVAEGSVAGLNDADSRKKAQIMKDIIFASIRDRGQNLRNIFPTEAEFNTTNNYFVRSKPADQKNMFALCYTGLPAEAIAKFSK